MGTLIITVLRGAIVTGVGYLVGKGFDKVVKIVCSPK